MAHWKLTFYVDDDVYREALSNRLFEWGAEGVSETVDKGISQGLTTFFPESEKERLTPEIEKYLAELAGLFPHVGSVRWDWQPLLDQNWAEKYKEFYRAQKLTHRFFLKPAWDLETKVPLEMWPIVLDPGQAFGTGLHASTKLSIRLMEDIASFYPRVDDLRLIDVGTGTGILAMAATHLGFGDITAIDNDPPSVEVARENLIKNKCERVKISGQLLDTFTEPFNVIVSNILLETHLQLAPHYARLLVPGGQIVLSGLLGGQKPYLEAALRPLGFVPLVSYHLQEWAAYGYVLRNDRT